MRSVSLRTSASWERPSGSSTRHCSRPAGGCSSGPEGASGNTWTDLDGQPVDLDQVQTVWHRRRFHPEPPARASELDRLYYRREWNEMLTGVLASMGAWFVNDPGGLAPDRRPGQPARRRPRRAVAAAAFGRLRGDALEDGLRHGFATATDPT
jgi:hypothetical protein